MSRVLIWKRVYPGSEYDIFHPTDYTTLYERTMKEWGGVSQNWGNKLWFQGIYSAVDTGENTYDFLPEQIDPEAINSEYDFILLPMANIFFVGYAEAMRSLASIFEKIRIPIYVVACGVQAEGYDDLENVIRAIGTDAGRFIRSIYNTGGEFALRGHFTKEFFDRLGFHSAVVTGCPSLYQMGPDFQVPVHQEPDSGAPPVFNGSVRPFAELMKAYPDSVFVDQCEYFRPLYQPDYMANRDVRFKLDFLNSYGIESARFLGEGRIVLIADMNAWSDYLRSRGFGYAFGSRIHGTIMALLSGIPATIVTFDSRTREMAEFFEIPHAPTPAGHRFTVTEFIKLHEQMDYTAFNRNFRGKFDAYQKFLADHHIVSKVNTENPFFAPSGNLAYMDAVENRKEDFRELFECLNKEKTILNFANQILKIKGRFF